WDYVRHHLELIVSTLRAVSWRRRSPGGKLVQLLLRARLFCALRDYSTVQTHCEERCRAFAGTPIIRLLLSYRVGTQPCPKPYLMKTFQSSFRLAYLRTIRNSTISVPELR